MDDRNINAPLAKLFTLWAAVGISSWQEAAAAAAALYSFLLIFEWTWKKVWRPILELAGWLKPRAPRRRSTTDWDEL
ncbi:hypothetical protein [Pulveribacter sp.]|uniref:hypothetical protein n=1 Tax=Pulveribacter sp. TaxID=2678893 RepID=UPI0028AC2127|nr:hypothetical protein [Pulveribacter sp.]